MSNASNNTKWERVSYILFALPALLTFLLVFWIWTTLTISLSYKILFTICSAIPVLLIIGYIRNRRFANILLSISVLSALLLLGELIIRISILNGNATYLPYRKVLPGNTYQIPYFDRETARFDSIAGFRWSSEPTTVMKAGNGKLEYVNTFKGNNYGYHSKKNYLQNKLPGVYRIIVLGDSFTDAFFLQTPWPDRVEQMLNERNQPIELYSFSVNGGGILNWHSIFFREILHNFEFDAVILAIFGNNLNRDFFVMHHEKGSAKAMYFPDAPNYKIFSDVSKSTKGIPVILPKNTFSHFLDHYKNPLQWYEADLFSLNLLHHLVMKTLFRHGKQPDLSNLLANYIYSTGTDITDEDIIRKYGNHKISLLKEIITVCQENQKDITLVAIPERTGAILTMQKNPVQIATEVEHLSSMFGTRYWNGYSNYTGGNEKIIDTHFMASDGHWNQYGSDFFARYIYEALIKE